MGWRARPAIGDEARRRQMQSERELGFMKSGDIINAAMPGFVAGCILFVISTFVGPIIGPGWTDLLQGLSFFVGLVWILLAVRRKQSAHKQV
jgi:hypothetical protein